MSPQAGIVGIFTKFCRKSAYKAKHYARYYETLKDPGTSTHIEFFSRCTIQPVNTFAPNSSVPQIAVRCISRRCGSA